MASIRLSLLAIIVFVSQLHAKDPIQDFCRRWGHQTAQVDGKLYIDGGLVTWNPMSANPDNFTNTWLLYSDLNSTTQGYGMPYQYANLTKNSTVPSVSGGVLWADEVNKCFYQFGGEYQSDPADFSFWTYDARLNQWNESSPESNVALQRVAYGAGTQIEDFGMGYYFGGYMNNLTTKNWKGPSIATSGLISYDFTAGKLSNNSGPPDNIGRAEGQLVYLPASDGGMLVYFGGVEDSSQNGTFQATIHIYDISSNKWYTQRASGQVPGARRQFCAGATWADDQSSYNMYVNFLGIPLSLCLRIQSYLYGGFAAEGANGYDDAYILSLPSFTWINIFSTGNATNTQPFPHGACSANVINRDQMLIIGGWFTNSSFKDCDSQGSQGQHNMNLGYNGGKNVLWDHYDPSATKYFVPTPVISAIGGGPTGGATLTKPSSWDNGDLSILLTRQASFTARSATRVIPSGTANPSDAGSSKKTRVGAIAGGVVGGLAGLILILLLVLFCLHRRKKALKAGGEKSQTSSPPPPVELAATSPIHEMHSPGTTKYMSLQQQPDMNAHPAYSGPNSVHSRSPSNDYLNPVVSPYQPQQYPASTSPTFTATYPSPYNTNDYPAANYAQQHDHHAASAEGTQFSFSGSDRQAHTRSPPSTTQTPAQFYAAPVPVRGPHVMSNSGGGLSPGLYSDHDAGSAGNDRGSVRSVDSRKRPVRGRFVEVDDL
ncbi:hypothetical protein N0V90_009050 [Kalmusia sp. IMI 367209]|nr:hypothetical protein N0V90_009050 [Kalmusia sp. IMI 367209]